MEWTEVIPAELGSEELDDAVTRRRDSPAALADAQGRSLTYAVVTCVYNDAAGLEGLAECLRSQTAVPAAWVIVDDGSTDETLYVAAGLALRDPWIVVVEKGGNPTPSRGPGIAEAFEVGLGRLHEPCDVVVRVDADVSVDFDFFSRLLLEFERDPRLGVASGSRVEQKDGDWRQRFVTGDSVEAQCRAYRSSCLQAVQPFDRHRGWDGVDVIRARLNGWRTLVVRDLFFRHHRPIGTRDGSRLRAWRNEGVASYSMGYRPLYLLARCAYHMSEESAAAGLIVGYVQAFLRREPRAGQDIRVVVRRDQSLLRLPKRAREARGGRSTHAGRADLLLVAGPGGHLYELSALDAVWRHFSRAWVTVEGADVSILPGEQIFFAHGPTCRSVKKLLRNGMVAARLLFRLRPRVIIATGDGIVVPFIWVGWLFRSRVVFLECSGRLDLSLSARLVAPVVDRLYVQWPEAVPLSRRARYRGSVFFSNQ